MSIKFFGERFFGSLSPGLKEQVSLTLSGKKASVETARGRNDKARPYGLAFGFGGPPRSRTGHQRIMRTTSAFAAPFGFVVWTVSCLYGSPVQSLHLP